MGGERIGWEYHNISLTRVKGYGFGIAVSGGRDNPHFIDGEYESSITISDVLKDGPAEGKLYVNDIVMNVNGVSLENVDYNSAVQVLRECGNCVNLLIKRKVSLQANNDLLKVTLTKSKRKDDFGIVLGCRLFIKEITNRSLIEKDRESCIEEGDLVVKINNTSTENLSLKEAKKLIESSKEKLNLVIRRELNGNNAQNQSSQSQRWSSSNLYDNASAIKDSQTYDNSVHNNNNNSNNNNNNRSNWSNQNVYVQPPTRGDYARHTSHATHATHNTDDKNNLNKIARNRGPIMDISLHQLDQPATPLLTSSAQHSQHSREASQECATSATAIACVPPRPPPPRPSCAIPEEATLPSLPSLPLSPLSLSLRSKSQISAINEVQTQSQSQSSQTRLISFQKDNNNSNMGIRLTGGNVYGIFVTAVHPSSAACLQGLQAGDKILKANNTDMRGVTREEAVLFLLSIQQQIDLYVQYRKEEYDEIIASQKGDSFYIRVHFAYESTVKGELSFHVAEVFHVIDTLYSGIVGSWLVYRLGRNNQEIQKGAIPNQTRAEELAAAKAAKNKDEKVNESSSRGSFWSKRRSARKSKLKYQWEDVVGSGDNLSKFSAYERVTLKHAGFIRPVVLFGPLADVARDKLLKDYPDKYAFPQLDSIGNNGNSGGNSGANSGGNSANKCSIVRLSAIKEIIDKAKHALLDITPSAVDRLNYAQFYPIVIFMRAENKSVVKELRSRLPKSMHKSSRKLYDNGVKIEKLWSHVFTATITLTNAGQEMWYKKLRETLEKQQQQSIWVAESKPEEAIGDDFLFPLTSRLSYASSPESDLDITNDDSRLDNDIDNDKDLIGRLGLGLVKASSDPSIATAEDTNPMCGDKPAMNTFGYPPPYSVHTNIANIANCSNPPIRPTNPPPNTKQLPLHILLRKELSKALTNEAKTKTLNTTSIDDVDRDREEYFGSGNNNNNISPEERYPLSPVSPTCDIYGTKHSHHTTHSPSQPQPPHNTAPEPPPRIDRNSKPSRFRSAHERLFGRRDDRHRDVNIFNTPDYINTTQKCDSLDRQQQQQVERLLTNGRSNSLSGPAFGDSSSYSSDSYNKYGSPSSTLDNKHHNSHNSHNNYNHHNRYNSVASTNSTHNSNQNRATHDPYRFTRSTAQPHPHQSKQSNTGSPSKYVTEQQIGNCSTDNNNGRHKQQINVTPQSQTHHIHSRPPPPSPPPKPNNYQQTTRIQSDGRPVPPPKPSHYQLTRPQLPSQQAWYSDSANEAIESNHNFGHNYSSVYNTTNSKRASNGCIGGNVSNGGNCITNGGIELSNGPPAYYPHKQHIQHTQHTDQPPNVRAPQIPNYGADHTISSHIRKGAPYSDTDSSSGYMTSHTKTANISQSSYAQQDIHQSMRSPYSSQSQSNQNCGPYLNVPYPPKHQHNQHYRYDSNSTPTQHSTQHSIQLSPQPPQPPSNLIDLSINREQRGSAFELFRK